MQSSYNLIRKNQAYNASCKKISTEYQKNIGLEEDGKVVCVESGKTLEEIQDIIKNYESIGKSIILDGKRQKDEIIFKAMEKAQVIEREAYEKGYSQGKTNGYEDGKNQAIENILPQAERQASETIERAEEILNRAKEDYLKYLESKKEDIIKLSIAIAEKIIKKKVALEDGINEILEEGIALSKGEENIVIKCNPHYVDSIKERIPLWKSSYSISGEIFILSNENITLGKAIIEKSSGKVEVGIDIGIEAIEKALLS